MTPTPDSEQPCPTCGAARPAGPGAAVCGRCGAAAAPAIEAWFDAPGRPPWADEPPPEPPVVEPEPEVVELEPDAVPLPDSALDADDVPVVRPSGRPARDTVALPEARPVAAPRREPAPVRPPARDDADDRPRSQTGLAVLVIAGLLAAVVVGLSVIGYAIWAGFKTVARPPRAEARPGLVEAAASPVSPC